MGRGLLADQLPARHLPVLFTQTLWLKLGIFVTLIYSVYAQLQYGLRGNVRCYGSFRRGSLPEIQAEPLIPPEAR